LSLLKASTLPESMGCMKLELHGVTVG
jgi:hypothetical protein